MTKNPGANEIFHVAIFRFNKEHLNEAMVTFRALASASRRESGNLRYEIYRGIDDDQEFYVVEHWASPAALAAHERTESAMRRSQEKTFQSSRTMENPSSRKPMRFFRFNNLNDEPMMRVNASSCVVRSTNANSS